MPSSPKPSRGTAPRGGSTRGGSSRRGAPTKVSKPFPWGTAVGSAVLALALIGIVAYAAMNQGSGIPGNISDPDSSIEGVQVADAAALGRTHVNGPVTYPTLPPSGGDHNAVPQQCAVYTEPIAPERAVHSLEHGAVWITYQPSLPKEQVEQLADKAQGDPYMLMSPVAEQASPIVLTSWGRSLQVQTAGDDRVDDFVSAYRNGPATPERGAACVGSTATGPLVAAPAGVPAAPASPPAG
ncbi:MAG: hypothetical protein JWN88_817 [Frankiales bacterium]|jgi:hypothetical protein|nr:hypothetical protein [Frankiales bacterium]